MTPEERNRTIDFIIESQARLAAAQERDRHDRLKFEEWSKGMDQKLIDLIEVQSSRLDYYEKEQRLTQKRHEEFRDLQLKALARLDRILEKLTDKTN
jgi:hypothetical protein